MESASRYSTTKILTILGPKSHSRRLMLTVNLGIQVIEFHEEDRGRMLSSLYCATHVHRKCLHNDKWVRKQINKQMTSDRRIYPVLRDDQRGIRIIGYVVFLMCSKYKKQKNNNQFFGVRHLSHNQILSYDNNHFRKLIIQKAHKILKTWFSIFLPKCFYVL